MDTPTPQEWMEKIKHTSTEIKITIITINMVRTLTDSVNIIFGHVKQNNIHI